MSVKYIDKDGNIINASGLTPGGNLEAGAVATRSGVATIPSKTTGDWGYINVNFDDPMPDNIYEVVLSAEVSTYILSVANKATTGFRIGYYVVSPRSAALEVSWTATKTYTVQHDIQNTQAIADIQEAIPTGAGAANQLTTKSYVDNADNSLDLRIDDLEDLVPTGSTITNQLVNKSELQTAISNVHIDVDSALDSTSENPVQNKVVKGAIDKKQDKIFVGTTTEWNALTPTEQNVYNLVSLTNDSATGDVVDTVTDGVMKPVTSNAVYDFMTDTITNGVMKPVTSNAVFDAMENKAVRDSKHISSATGATVVFTISLITPVLVFAAPWSGSDVGMYWFYPNVVGVQTITASSGITNIQYSWATKELTITTNRTMSIGILY